MNGIGGRTIAEAKLNMTNAEVSQWAAFKNKYGSLFFGRRIEQAIGNLYTFYVNGKLEAKDRIKDARVFMPHEEQEPELSLEDQFLMQFGDGT